MKENQADSSPVSVSWSSQFQRSMNSSFNFFFPSPSLFIFFPSLLIFFNISFHFIFPPPSWFLPSGIGKVIHIIKWSHATFPTLSVSIFLFLLAAFVHSSFRPFLGVLWLIYSFTMIPLPLLINCNGSGIRGEFTRNHLFNATFVKIENRFFNWICILIWKDDNRYELVFPRLLRAFLPLMLESYEIVMIGLVERRIMTDVIN